MFDGRNRYPRVLAKAMICLNKILYVLPFLSFKRIQATGRTIKPRRRRRNVGINEVFSFTTIYLDLIQREELG